MSWREDIAAIYTALTADEPPGGTISWRGNNKAALDAEMGAVQDIAKCNWRHILQLICLKRGLPVDSWKNNIFNLCISLNPEGRAPGGRQGWRTNLADIRKNIGSTQWWEEYGEMAKSVKSNGINNYIDPAIPMQADLVVNMALKYNTLAVGERHVFGGYQAGTTTTRQAVDCAAVTSDRKMFFGAGNGWTVTNLGLYTGVVYTFMFEMFKTEQRVYSNKTQVGSSNRTMNPTGDIDMYIFKRGGISSTPYININLEYLHVAKPDGAVLADLRAFYISKKAITDTAGRVHPVGTYVMLDLHNRVVPATYGDAMTGERLTGYAVFGERAFSINDDSGKYTEPEYIPLYVTEKPVVDEAGNTLPVGSFVWWHEATNTAAATGPLTGTTTEDIQTMAEEIGLDAITTDEAATALIEMGVQY